MAVENGNGVAMQMPVAPAYGAYPIGNYGGGYGSGGFLGNSGDWLILFLFMMMFGGWGMGGFGGFGMMNGMYGAGIDYLYPWLNNSEHISDGFRDQQLSTQIGNIQSSITSGFGDAQLGIAGVNQNICQTGNGITNAINQNFANTNLAMRDGFNGVSNGIFNAQTAISQQLNNNELASLNRSFAEQTANTAGFTGVSAGIADLRYTEATENCATRTAAAQNTRDIIDSQTRGTQAILDKLCALELDGVKSQLAQAQRENVGLQNAINMAAFRESQANQNALFAQGMTAEVDALYNRLKSCPVNTVPVAGNTPLFSCNPGFNNPGCGCGFGA